MQPPVGQLPTLCIPASESSSPCWYALHGVLIPVTMIGAPTARSADLPATTLYVRHRLHLTFALVPLHTHTQGAASAPRLTVQCTHSMLRLPPAQPGALATVVSCWHSPGIVLTTIPTGASVRGEGGKGRKHRPHSHRPRPQAKAARRRHQPHQARPGIEPGSRRGASSTRLPYSSYTRPAPGPTWRIITRQARRCPARLSQSIFSGPYARGARQARLCYEHAKASHSEQAEPSLPALLAVPACQLAPPLATRSAPVAWALRARRLRQA